MNRKLLQLLLGALLMGGVLGGIAWYRHPDRVALQPHLVDEEVRADDLAQLQQALAGAQSSEVEGPDLLVVVVDGLGAQDPSLSSLEGFQRSDLLACSEHPVSSQACLLTGLPPSGHGAYMNQGLNGLRRQVPTLVTRAHDAGWTTLGFTGERKLRSARTGLGRGFDVYLGEDLARGSEKFPYAQADRVVDLALEGLHRSSGRRLIWVQLADGRPPWIPRRGYVDPQGSLDAYYLPEGGTRPRDLGFREAHRALMDDGEVPPAAIQTWETSRAAEFAFIDAELSRLLAGLEPDTQVVVVGSVGTEFPGHLELGGVLSDSVLRVPLYTRNLSLDAHTQIELAQALAAELALVPLWRWSVDDPGIAEEHRGGKLRLWIDGQIDDPHAPLTDPELAARAAAWRAGVSSQADARAEMEESP